MRLLKEVRQNVHMRVICNIKLTLNVNIGWGQFFRRRKASLFFSFSDTSRHGCAWHIYCFFSFFFFFKPMRKQQTAWDPLGVVYHNNEANDEWKRNQLHLQTAVNWNRDHSLAWSACTSNATVNTLLFESFVYNVVWMMYIQIWLVFLLKMKNKYVSQSIRL